MRQIACLHTAASNAALFDRAAPGGMALRHMVRENLLAAVEASGGLTAEIAEAMAVQLAALSATADAVILTCSSLGEGLDPAGPVIRADAALVVSALAAPGRVAVLYTAPTSRGPTERVFRAASGPGGGVPEFRRVEGAWEAFRSGDAARATALVREAVRAAAASGVDRIALAQCSMAPAADGAPDGPPVLTVPQAALARALAG